MSKVRKKGGSSGLKAKVILGKFGLTEAWLDEVKRRLKKEKTLKIRVARSQIRAGLSTRDVAMEVAGKVGAKVIDVRGHTFTLRVTNKS